ncbi:hypothetical protein KL86APRO_30235 [uncultured Alphaproteobacteria bacterium]|uniref:Uncharacterized protein n=1 Tax=uncultured Alphaproteobacteria bacterium TaxID=91750 RepID=A0A212KM65_9PROT|nr:hypothetical protein KL86APRO_30235 [uncultured Alphaproteobacteria bacterium]
MTHTPKLYAAPQRVRRKPKFFRLDPTNEARLNATLARYADLLGCPVSLSVLIPRALVALNDELNRAEVCEPASGELAMPTLEARERFIIGTLSPA